MASAMRTLMRSPAGRGAAANASRELRRQAALPHSPMAWYAFENYLQSQGHNALLPGGEYIVLGTNAAC
jgi:hypothetical protein